MYAVYFLFGVKALFLSLEALKNFLLLESYFICVSQTSTSVWVERYRINPVISVEKASLASCGTF